MKIYYIPENIYGLIFDIDLTLYDNMDYYNSQTDVLIKRLAHEQNKDHTKLKDEIEAYKKQYSEKNSGRRPSLGNIFLDFGIPIERSVRWREELHRPEDFLKKDPGLLNCLNILKNRYKLIAVTNNPSSIGKRTLKALGIENIFISVIGLDNSMVSKPHKKPFELAKEKLDMEYNNIISIGDRYEVDLEIPLKLGMGGILVEKIDDIYKLTDILI